MNGAVGIDLGTTNCAVAQVDSHGRPEILSNADGEKITPSVICFKDGEILIGSEAKELQRAGEPEVAAFFKRQIGNRHFALSMGGRTHTATDLSALLLGRLKQDAELTLGREVRGAVITVPAYFRHPERQATIDAGGAAGLNVLQVINEPTAAAIAFGMRKVEREQLILVYDLGGGTFDVTLLRLGPDEIRVLTSDGDQELGGKDWDLRLLDYLDTRFSIEHGFSPCEEAENAADLLVLAEEAKQRLSTTDSTTVTFAAGGARGRYRLDRAIMEEITRDLMERTISLTEKVLGSRDLSPAADLDGVLLVGGSTRMPMVREFIRERLGQEPMKGVNVDEAVALGAAIAAAEPGTKTSARRAGSIFGLSGRTRTVDVTTHSLGMIALNKDRSAYTNSIILSKDSEIPSTQVRPFQHPIRVRTADLEVFLTQGESESPAEVTYLGKYAIKDVPAAEGGQNQVLEIGYSYDRSGTVSVAAQVKSSGQALTVSVEPLPDDVPARFLVPPQPVEIPAHTTVYLIIDCSGSMSGAPLEEAKKAANSFLRNLDLAHCSVGLLSFHNKTRIDLKACSNAKKIASAIDRLDSGGGTTANPFEEVHKLLGQEEGNRFAVVLTDGQWFRQQEAESHARQCHDDGIEVVAIGFGSADQAFLKRIASTDEAGLFTDLSRLVETFETIAQVITGGGAVTIGAPTAGTRGKSSLGWFGKEK